MRSNIENEKLGYGPLFAALVGFLSVGSLWPVNVFMFDGSFRGSERIILPLATFAAALFFGALVDVIVSRNSERKIKRTNFWLRGVWVAGFTYIFAGVLGLVVTGLVIIWVVGLGPA